MASILLRRTVAVQNGVPLMSKITGTGCSVTALAAAFIAVDREHALNAAAFALCIFGCVIYILLYCVDWSLESGLAVPCLRKLCRV